MATKLTPQQLADATAKRVASQRANRAAGVPTVKQQRAAAKAAKLGTPFAPPPPRSTPPPFVSSHGGRARRRRNSWNRPVAPPVVVSGPVFSTPRPNYRALKLAALVALEAAFIQKLEDAGGVKNISDDTRAAFALYKKVKALALGATSSSAAQTEADSALRLATVQLVKLAY